MAFIILNGRLGKKPESRTSQTGASYLLFSVAISEKKDETTWFNCVWMEPGRNPIVSFLDKGSSVSVVGRLRKPKTYQKKNGETGIDLSIFVSDISFLPTSKSAEERTSVFTPSEPTIGQAQQELTVEDDLPF